MIKKKTNKLILFFSILVFLALVGVYMTIHTSQNKLKKLMSKDDKYYETFGESCFDRVTDDYLRGVCEKIKENVKKDTCYYGEGVSTGYNRICHLIGNETLKQKCLEEVNVTLSNNETLKQRAEKYNPYKRYKKDIQ